MSKPVNLAVSRGDLLRRLRTRRQLSQHKLAKKAGLSSSAIQQIEADMRGERGTYPDTAATLLRVLDQLETLTEQELAEFVQYFPIRDEDLRTILADREADELTESGTPAERIERAVNVIAERIGPDEAASLLENTAIALHTAAQRERAGYDARLAPRLDRVTRQLSKVYTRIQEQEGAVVEQRTHYNANGEPLTPVPEGEGVIDDPDLIHLEAEIQAVTRAREEGKPLPSVSPAAQRVLDLISEAVKSDRNKNTA